VVQGVQTRADAPFAKSVRPQGQVAAGEFRSAEPGNPKIFRKLTERVQVTKYGCMLFKIHRLPAEVQRIKWIKGEK
jgi:anthranilate/para-aminobenzoate synthase component II